jgi:hypothetical protein
MMKKKNSTNEKRANEVMHERVGFVVKDYKPYCSQGKYVADPRSATTAAQKRKEKKRLLVTVASAPVFT